MKYNLIESGKRIRLLRNRLGLTQERMSEKMGITREYLSMVERGVCGISIDLLIQFAEFYRCSVDYLILGEEPYRTNQFEPELAKAVLAVMHKHNMLSNDAKNYIK